ncbi:MAG TPA: hypothetical protein VFG10_12610 [Saprospiraceae bacterium]|nr:hypothetical protein [Saprospiraceae bacterium]
MNQDSIKSYYSAGIEKDRLQQIYFKLEGIRTKEIISRYLTDKSNVIDIGGGTGCPDFFL